MGLPSGTLWLDRMVGAPSPVESGLFYQWGDIVGHAFADGYDFSSANYEAKGLNLISADLDSAHDAAKAYYGPEAKMPSISQFEELISNCVVSNQGHGVFLITSNINGHSIKIRGNGYLGNFHQYQEFDIFAWSTDYNDSTNAWSVHNQDLTLVVQDNHRYVGFNVMAVHS